MYTLDDLNRDTSLYFGGGAVEARPGHFCKGGSGAAKASLNYQKQQDADLKRRVEAATNTINRIFDDANREAQYQQQRDAVYKLNTDEVNRQAADQLRANRFALARNGLLGGSTDAESTADINDATNKGLLKAAGIADDSAAQLKTADEQTRQNLLNLASSGIDTGSASTMATQQLNGNLQNAASDRATASITGLFNDLASAYKMYGMGQALNKQAALASNIYGTNGYGATSDPRRTYTGS